MSRILTDTSVEIDDADDLSSDFFEHRFIQAADPETMERLFDQQLADFSARPNEDWRMAFVDLAGAGDGHVFTLSTMWFRVVQGGPVVTSGVQPPPGLNTLKMFFFMASQSESLAAARRSVNAKIKARFDEPNVGSVTEIQTILGGAQQGSRFMGGVGTTTASDIS